jgi:hypothetical protein
MTNGSRALMVGVVAGLAGACAAEPLVFTVDPGRSSISVTIELQTVLGNRTDSDSSAVNGFVLAGADSYNAPGSVVLYDFELLAADVLDFAWSYGFAGGATATLTGAGLVDGAPNLPKGPVPVVNDAFTVLGVPTQSVGLAEADYNILVVGSGSSTVDLGAEAPVLGSFPGTITVTGATVEVTSTISFGGTFPLIDGVATAVVTGTGTVVAVAARGCAADLSTPFGSLDFFDVSAFLAAYGSEQPAADFVVDGVWNFFDVSAFLGAYNAGCD